MKNKKMKVCLMTTVALLIGSGALLNHPTQATEKKPVPDTVQTEPFQDLKDNDSIIVMQSGGYLHGKATILNKSSHNIVATYDSDQPLSDKNDGLREMTVAETRQKIRGFQRLCLVLS